VQVKSTLLLPLALALLSCTPAEVAQPPVHLDQRGLWVWSNLPSIDPQVRAGLLQLAAQQRLTTLYLQAQTLVYDAPAALHQAISDAAEAGLEVELLAGKHSWVRPAEHAELLALLSDLRGFVAHAAGPKAVAIHLNIEPHALAEWDSDRQALANALIDLLELASAALQGSGLQLVYDMPNWYDDIAVVRGGVQRPLSQWLQDRVDRVVLMDYRDDPALMLQLAAGELAYADQIGRRVVIGAETRCQLDPAITWCEEGRAALQAGLEQVSLGARQRLSFAGTAIHDWKGLAALGQ
jgi:hypothetical protein